MVTKQKLVAIFHNQHHIRIATDLVSIYRNDNSFNRNRIFYKRAQKYIKRDCFFMFIQRT